MHFQEQDAREETAASMQKSAQAPFSRGELTGMVMATCLLGYGIFQQDIPVIFLTGSFLFFEIHVFSSHLKSTVGKNVSNLTKGISLALFAGSLFMLLFS